MTSSRKSSSTSLVPKGPGTASLTSLIKTGATIGFANPTPEVAGFMSSSITSLQIALRTGAEEEEEEAAVIVAAAVVVAVVAAETTVVEVLDAAILTPNAATVTDAMGSGIFTDAICFLS